MRPGLGNRNAIQPLGTTQQEVTGLRAEDSGLKSLLSYLEQTTATLPPLCANHYRSGGWRQPIPLPYRLRGAGGPAELGSGSSFKFIGRIDRSIVGRAEGLHSQRPPAAPCPSLLQGTLHPSHSYDTRLAPGCGMGPHAT
jgi:hypothetical protein